MHQEHTRITQGTPNARNLRFSPPRASQTTRSFPKQTDRALYSFPNSLLSVDPFRHRANPHRVAAARAEFRQHGARAKRHTPRPLNPTCKRNARRGRPWSTGWRPKGHSSEGLGSHSTRAACRLGVRTTTQPWFRNPSPLDGDLVFITFCQSTMLSLVSV